MFSAGAAPRLRTGLPPISQDQFEQFGNIDTDEVVRQIKDYLSMNSISQRQFGETVLGLSQGENDSMLSFRILVLSQSLGRLARPCVLRSSHASVLEP